MIDLLIAAVIAASHHGGSGHSHSHHASYQLDDQDSWGWVRTRCTQATPCYNGHIPGYNDPDCWPGAIYCTPAQKVSDDRDEEQNSDDPDEAVYLRGYTN